MRQVDPRDALAGPRGLIETLAVVALLRRLVGGQAAQALAGQGLQRRGSTERPLIARAQFALDEVLARRHVFAVVGVVQRLDHRIGSRLIAAHGGGGVEAAARQRLRPVGGDLGGVLDLARVFIETLDHGSIRRLGPDRAVAAVVVKVGLQLGRQLQRTRAPAPRILRLSAGRDPAVGRGQGADLDQALGVDDVFAHHIGQDSITCHIDAARSAADQFDALDRSRRDTTQQVRHVLALAGRPHPVDQDIALRPGIAAHISVRLDQGKARCPVQHLARTGGGRSGKDAGGIGRDACRRISLG